MLGYDERENPRDIMENFIYVRFNVSSTAIESFMGVIMEFIEDLDR